MATVISKTIQRFRDLDWISCIEPFSVPQLLQLFRWIQRGYFVVKVQKYFQEETKPNFSLKREKVCNYCIFFTEFSEDY